MIVRCKLPLSKSTLKKSARKCSLKVTMKDPALPEWATVAKSQKIETLSTSTETWWKDFVGHKGRITRNKTTTTGVVGLCFIMKPIVNDINEVIKGILIAAEDKGRDKAAKKIVKTIEIAAYQASKN